MRFTADKKSFAAALAAAVRVVKRNATIPILANVLIEAAGEGVTVTGDSLDIRIVAPFACAVEEPGSLTMPGHLLNDIVRRFPDSATIVLEQGAEGRVAVRAGKARFAVPFLPAESFPADRAADRTHRFVVPALEFAKALNRTIYAIAKDGRVVYLDGAHLHAHVGEAGPVLRIVATDTHVLSCSELPQPDGAAGMPGIIVPSTTIPEIVRLAESGEVTIATSDRLMSLHFASGVTLVTKLIEGTFPQYLRIVPDGGDKAVLADAAALSAALGRIALVADIKGTAFQFGTDSVSLSVENGEKGAFNEELEVDTAGVALDFRIGLNAAYVGSTLAALDCDEVEMTFTEPGAAGLFRPKGRKSPFGLVMPMRA